MLVIHFISAKVAATLLYSASVELLETASCLFEAHEIRFCPRKMMYSVVDFLSSELEPQSISIKACN